MRNTLLVIDDDRTVQEIIRGHFECRDFDVYTAGDGLEGIEVCRDVMPDVILIDLKMKKMDGDEAVPYLREIVPHSSIFVLSAHRNRIDANRAAGLEVDSYLEKPVSIIELEYVLEEALKSEKPSVTNLTLKVA
jgi:CheY-like chemotaxis protein